MATEHYPTTIDHIVNRNFGNTYHHNNCPNQRQFVNKHTGKQ